MNKKELQFILQEGEGLKIEFKSSFDKSISKEIVAFANATGGRIFLGVDDSGIVKGLDITNRLKSQIQDVAKNCDPDIRADFEKVECGAKTVLVVVVAEGDNKPYQCSAGFYLRQGASSQKLSRDEIIEFSVGEGKIKFDSQISKKFSFDDDFDNARFQEYLKSVNIEPVISEKDMLRNFGLFDGTNFNNACVLFFARNPERFFLTSKVVCVTYQGNDKVKILDRKILDSGILNNIREAIGYVERHIDVEFEIKSAQRKEIPQYPEEAIRETIVNAVMHRDYFDDSGDVVIEVFKNRLLVSNPGGLVKSLKPSDFGTCSRLRNSLIANMLMRTIYVEKLGTGITRIRNAMKKAGLPEPEFDYNYSFFVTLYDKTHINVPANVPVEVPANVPVNKRQEWLLRYLRDHGKITTKVFHKQFKEINIKTIKRDLADLKRKVIIKFIGAPKTGHYELVKKR